MLYSGGMVYLPPVTRKTSSPERELCIEVWSGAQKHVYTNFRLLFSDQARHRSGEFPLQPAPRGVCIG